MSSILEALKKAESESSQKDEVQIHSGKFSLSAGQPRPVHRSRFKWIFVVVVIVVAAVGVWIFRPAATVSTSENIQSNRTTPPKKKAPQQPPNRTQHKTLSRDTARKAATRPPPVKTTTRPEDRGTSRPLHPVGPPGKIQAKAPPPQHPPKKTASRPAAKPKSQVYLRSGHGLTLQAIAWDPDKKKRFAVINNQIIREGQTVDGKVVKHISEDEIIVVSGSKHWKIEFRIE